MNIREKMNIRKLIIPIVCLLAVLQGLAAQEASNSAFQPAAFERYVEPTFPLNLMLQGYLNGEVEIALDIDENGEIVDWLPLSTTHPDFIRAIKRVIDEWQFNPARRNGEAVPVIQYIEFRFSHRGVRVLSNDITQLWLRESYSPAQDSSLITKLSELDKLPEPVDITRPVFTQEVPEEELSGRVVVTFFIDENGDVRLPVVTEIDGNIALAEAAFRAISQWKFLPPTQNGRPVTTKARQAFIFSPD